MRRLLMLSKLLWSACSMSACSILAISSVSAVCAQTPETTLVAPPKAPPSTVSVPTTQAFMDLFGKPIEPLLFQKRKATLFFFVVRDCPISNYYAPEMRRLAAEYAPKGVASFIVYVEPDIATSNLRSHYREFAFSCPALHDKDHFLVQRFKVKRTPETVVLGQDGSTLYQGRIDDRYLDFGKSKHQPGRVDLRLALDSVLSGLPVRIPLTPVIGCPIPEMTK